MSFTRLSVFRIDTARNLVFKATLLTLSCLIFFTFAEVAFAAGNASQETMPARTASKLKFGARGFAITTIDKAPEMVDISVSDTLTAPMSKTGKVKGDPSTPMAREGRLNINGKAYSLLVEKMENGELKAKIMKKGSKKVSKNDNDLEAAIKPKNLMIGTIKIKWYKDPSGGDGTGELMATGTMKIKGGDQEIDSSDRNCKLMLRGPMDNPNAGNPGESAVMDALMDSYSKGGDLTSHFEALDTMQNIMNGARSDSSRVADTLLNNEN
jgi:hypothetical protein